MDSVTKDILIKMVNQKELELKLLLKVRSI